MKLSDLPKDVQRLLLEYWDQPELDDRLSDPEYFFDQIVTPHMDFLRRSGTEAPKIRLQTKPNGELHVLLHY